MKLLHIQKSAGIGGSERHLLALLPALSERGHEARMVVLAADGASRFVTALADAGVPVRVIAAGPDANPVAVARIWKLVSDFCPDLVHTHLIHADVHGQLAAWLARVPGVLSVHGTPAPYRSEPSRSAAALAGRLAQRTIAISEHVEGFVRERRLAPPGRVRLIRYGIDLRAWKADSTETAHRLAWGLATNDLALVVASRLIPHKGHDFLLRAFAIAAAVCPELQLIIAGDGPLRPSLEAQAASMAATARVRFLGHEADMRSLLAASDIVAFPTLPTFGEGFGLVNLEASAMSRPVVGTKVDSVPEIVVDGETGLLVDPGDVAALANAVVRLARDSKLRTELGRQGRRRAEQLFGLDQMVEKTLAVYREVLD